MIGGGGNMSKTVDFIKRRDAFLEQNKPVVVVIYVGAIILSILALVAESVNFYPDEMHLIKWIVLIPPIYAAIIWWLKYFCDKFTK